MKKPLTQGQAGFNKIRVSDRIILYSIVSIYLYETTSEWIRFYVYWRDRIYRILGIFCRLAARGPSAGGRFILTILFLGARTSLTNISAFIKHPN
jgi:hypothetical protein